MSTPMYEMVWMGVGFLGQGIFTARFLVQWVASEKKRDSVVPVQFWWISLFGGLTLLSYTIHKQDPPLILGQAMGLVVYVRNLMLLEKARRRAERRQKRIEALTAATARQPLTAARGPHTVSRRVDAPGGNRTRVQG
ncbi:MAG: hypothetical protein NVSMB9_14600 [Isosphaeraceae bacterium]